MKHLLFVVVACSLTLAGCDPEGSASDGSAPSQTLAIKGSVRLPDFQNLESLGEGAVFRERPARDVPVVVRRRSQPGEPLAQTRTDADGNWRVSLPADTPLDGSVVAEATLDGSTLRRAVVTEFGNAVTIRSEALGRMLQEQTPSAAEIPRATYLNLLSMLATAADLTTPVDWAGDESVEEAVQRVRQAGTADARFGARLDAVGDDT